MAASVERRELLQANNRLSDFHIHTELAHCAQGITVDSAVDAAQRRGLQDIGFSEHAEQLYLPLEGFWIRTDSNDRNALRAAVDAGQSRHARYRELAAAWKKKGVLFGLEVEADVSGSGLAAFEEDLSGWDFLLGSVHQVDKSREKDLSAQEAAKLFRSRCEQLAEGGVEVLAHPLRYFRKNDRSIPEDTIAWLAELLASAGIAAEINFRNNQPDKAFFRMCLDRDVRLTLGSDAHSCGEVGDLSRHEAFLEELLEGQPLPSVLWSPLA